MHQVLIVGTQRVDSLESCYGRAFERLGWSVTWWDPNAALYRNTPGGRLGRIIANYVWLEPLRVKANLELLTLVQELRPELVLVIGTRGVRAGTLAQIRASAPEVALHCVFPDSPHLLASDRIECLPFFDRVATSSPAWVTAFKQLGGRRVHYLPFAADPEIHQPAAGGAEPIRDVAFIGSWRREREDLIEALSEFKVAVWGGHWGKHARKGSAARRAWSGHFANGPEFARVCSESRILLNIMDPVSRPGPNMRSFELPACGAFALAERSPAVLDLFSEGETIECYASPEEAREKIRHYLSDDASRRRIARKSHEFVHTAKHTYQDRARTLLAWLEEDRRA